MTNGTGECSQLPLSFVANDPATIHPTDVAPVDVVESTVVARPGLHHEFAAAARREGDRFEREPDDDDEGSDGHDVDPEDTPHRIAAAGDSRGGDGAREVHDSSHGAPARGDDERAARALRRRDRDERRQERDRRHGTALGTTDTGLARGYPPPPRTRSLVPRRRPRRLQLPGVRDGVEPRERRSDGIDFADLSARDHHRDRSADHVDPAQHPLTRVATGPVQGLALILYFVLLPYVVATKWRFSYTVTGGALVRDLLVGLAIFWLIFLLLLLAYVQRLRHARSVPANGCAWLAALVISALPFLVTSSAQASTGPPRTPSAVPAVSVVASRPGAAVPAGRDGATAPLPVGAFALALAAKGRRDRLRTTPDPREGDLDALYERLHDGDVTLVARLRDAVGSDLDGEVRIGPDALSLPARGDLDPVAVIILEVGDGGFTLGYAREGGALPVDLSRDTQSLLTDVVALHDGALRFARSPEELVRALARRRDATTLVVFLGDPEDLDEELRQLCVSVRPARGTPHFRGAPTRRVRVELLRAYPQVQGLVEDFTPTLRRRCLEMVAYLAMHPSEPVTGDRLRTRVLIHANVDASKTTLTNTASAVRRSLGGDDHGNFLEPVSLGLYHQRGVEFDVADFHRLVARARLAPADALDLSVRALQLVHGEPLASVLKGFEWFTFEGHRAQLQRDGEWVALALHDAALESGDADTAFWALRQGLLLDPDSDALLDALDRVPRLRQLRGDGGGAAQNQSVGPGRAVAVSWAFERFGR